MLDSASRVVRSIRAPASIFLAICCCVLQVFAYDDSWLESDYQILPDEYLEADGPSMYAASSSDSASDGLFSIDTPEKWGSIIQNHGTNYGFLTAQYQQVITYPIESDISFEGVLPDSSLPLTFSIIDQYAQFARFILPAVSVDHDEASGSHMHTYVTGITGGRVSEMKIVPPSSTVPADYVSFGLDLSSFPAGFTSFELSGFCSPRFRLYVDGSSVLSVKVPSVDLYVNDQLVRSFYSASSGIVDFGDYIYNTSVPISSIYFNLKFPSVSFSIKKDCSVYWVFGLDQFHRYTVLSVLSSDAVLDGYIDQAQDSINDYNSAESEWNAKLSSDYAALQLDNFKWPLSVVDAFGLLGSLFTRMWDVLGDAAIIYIMPLYLGISGIAIGRISRYASQQRSRDLKIQKSQKFRKGGS